MKSRFWRQCRTVCVGMLLIVLAGCGTVNHPSTQPRQQTKPKAKPAQKATPKPAASKPAASPTADADKFIQAGTAQLQQGDVNSAIASFKKAVKTDPKNAKAAQNLQQAEQKKAEMIDEHLRQGINYFNGDQLEQAMQEWNKVLSLDPGHAKAADYKQRTQARLNALQEK